MKTENNRQTMKETRIQERKVTSKPKNIRQVRQYISNINKKTRKTTNLKNNKERKQLVMKQKTRKKE
jgi:hypothetical protein